MLGTNMDVSECALERTWCIYGMGTGTAVEACHRTAAQIGSVRHLPAHPRPVRNIESLPACHQTIKRVEHLLLQQMRRPHFGSGFGQTNLGRRVLRLRDTGKNDLPFPSCVR